MASNKGQRYTDEQRLRALEIVEAGGTLAAASAEIGCSKQIVSLWRRQHEEEQGIVEPGQHRTHSERMAERDAGRRAILVEDIEWMITSGETHVENISRRLLTHPLTAVQVYAFVKDYLPEHLHRLRGRALAVSEAEQERLNALTDDLFT